MSALSISSSVIACAALGFVPEGVRAKEAGTCSFCGLHIAQGDLFSPFSVGPGFMDDASLAARGTGLTCGHCATLMTNEGLRASGYGVFTMKGAQPFRKWADISAALANPPDEPFVMVHATANNQHMAWRAPVNFSRDLFYVRVGLRDLKIRHATLMQAVKVSQEVALAFGYAATAKTLAHPFGTLSSDLKEIGHGSLMVFRKPKALDAQAHQELLRKHHKEIDFLMNLTLGETWALRFLLTPGAGVA